MRETALIVLKEQIRLLSLRISRWVKEVSPNDRTSAVSNCVTGAETGSSGPQKTRSVL